MLIWKFMRDSTSIDEVGLLGEFDFSLGRFLEDFGCASSSDLYSMEAVTFLAIANAVLHVVALCCGIWCFPKFVATIAFVFRRLWFVLFL